MHERGIDPIKTFFDAIHALFQAVKAQIDLVETCVDVFLGGEFFVGVGAGGHIARLVYMSWVGVRTCVISGALASSVIPDFRRA